MSDSNVIKLTQPGAFSDSLTEILRSGARALLTQAIEAEVAEFLAKHADLKTATGQQRVVRHGHLPERAIMTGIGGCVYFRDRSAERSVGRPSQLLSRCQRHPDQIPPVSGCGQSALMTAEGRFSQPAVERVQRSRPN